MAGIKGQPSPKPSSDGSPVPGQADEEAVRSYLAQYHAPQMNAAPSAPADQAPQGGQTAQDPEVAQYLSQYGGGQGQQQEQPGLIKQGLGYAARGLDYLGGNARTAIATGAGMLQNAVQGKNPLEQKITTDADVKNALKGQAPRAEEYLRRLGVDEGYDWNSPLGRITGRDVEGFALDVLTDPIGNVARAVKDAPYLKKLFGERVASIAGKVAAGPDAVLNAPNKAVEALGDAVYTSAYPGEAGRAMLEGVPEVGLGGASPIGTSAGLAKKVQDTSRVMGRLRQGLYDKADELGVRVNAADMDFKETNKVLDMLSRNKTLSGFTDGAKKMLEDFSSHGDVPISQMSEWKTELNASLPKNSWEVNGKLIPIAKQLKKAIASDFRKEIINAGESASPGLGKSIDALNDKWGDLLSVTDKMNRAAQGGGSKLGQIVDGMILGAGIATGHAAGAVAADIGYKLATSPAGKTVVGNALKAAGQHGLANRLLIDGAGQQINQPQGPNDQVPQQ